MTRLSLALFLVLVASVAIVACQQEGPDDLEVSEGALSPALISCGGPSGVSCDDGEFCWRPDGKCGSDKWGRCRTLPKHCSTKRAPVCGCDGITYANRCHAAMGGADVVYAGKCKAPCSADGDCGAGEVCGLLAEGVQKGYCEPAPPPATCESPCDCYEADLGFDEPCYALCPTCDNYWTCEAGTCQQACGAMPVQQMQCQLDCFDDSQCADGYWCDSETICLCPPDAPQCLAPCYIEGHCEIAECKPVSCGPGQEAVDSDADGCADSCETPCESVCDCYDSGAEYSSWCELDCFSCDMHWSCDEGTCTEHCGPVPTEAQQCTVDCLSGEECEAGYECVIETECPACVDAVPACGAPCWAKGHCLPSDAPPEGQCEGDADCPTGESCTPPEACTGCEGCTCHGTCEATGCYGEQDCPAGFSCNAGEVCLPPPGCKPGLICPAVCYGWCEGAP